MLFNSLDFVAFLALVAGGYALCPYAWRRHCLLAASYAFYCTWSLRFAMLLLAVSVTAFVFGRRIGAAATEPARRRELTIAVVLLLLPLAAFKYLGSVSGVVADLAGGAPLLSRFAVVSFVGAVGISYYTLKLISYLVDVYWERLEPARELTTLATYAAFFPQIVSGPIQRAGSLMSQLDALPPVTPAMVAGGLRLMLFGFFKKLVVADRLAIPVAQIFAHPGDYSGLAPLLGAYLFALQLYADFSGVTDIAIGTARLFGITSPQNFDSPFYADTIQDFWRRWHITLSTWLRDYVFTPLHMALRNWGQTGLIVALAINMLAIGIWHGPRWTYVVFGAMHAVYLIVSTLIQRRRKKLLQRSPALRRTHAVVGPLITFHLVVLSFVFFRAETVGDAVTLISRALVGVWQTAAQLSHGSLHGVIGGHLTWKASDVLIAVGGVALMEIVHALQHRGTVLPTLKAMPSALRWTVYAGLAFAILVWGESGGQFIYARF